MWKRLPRQTRDQKSIGNPILIETTYDENALGRMANVSDLRGGVNGGEPRFYYNGEDHSGAPSNLKPQTPYIQPDHDKHYRVSSAPTVSSIYSQPSPEVSQHEWGGYMAPSSPKYADVSPPSSPGMHTKRRESQNGPDISPIDESPQPPYHEHLHRSHGSSIPIPIRDSLGSPPTQPNRAVFRVAAGGSGALRYDEYSGEPTMGSLGKAQQVRPGHYDFESETNDPNKEYGYHASISAGNPSKKKLGLGERAARLGKSALSVETKPREEWKGLSGRSAMIEPLADKPAKQPLIFPSRTQRKPVQSSIYSPSTPVTRKAINSVENNSTSYQADSQTAPTELLPHHQELFDPIVPGRHSPLRDLAVPTTPGYGSQNDPSPVTPSEANVLREPTSAKVSTPSPYSVQPKLHAAEQTERPIANEAIIGHLKPGQRSEQINPSSRFSWTTYATTNYQSSPPPSPPHPMPEAIPINRKRAVLNSNASIASSSYPPRTPTSIPVISTTAIKDHSRNCAPSVFTTATSNTAKALPRPPPELESADLIGSLEAQQADLGIRRNNLTRLVDDVQNTQLNNPILMDIARRREAQRKIKEWKEELEEIASLEHDVGLKLHRARKRKAATEDLEPTTLWVKRVTSDYD